MFNIDFVVVMLACQIFAGFSLFFLHTRLFLNLTQKRTGFAHRRSQLTFFIHVLRRDKLEYAIALGKLDGENSRERSQEKMLDSVTKMHTKHTLNVHFVVAHFLFYYLAVIQIFISCCFIGQAFSLS